MSSGPSDNASRATCFAASSALTAVWPERSRTGRNGTQRREPAGGYVLDSSVDCQGPRALDVADPDRAHRSAGLAFR